MQRMYTVIFRISLSVSLLFSAQFASAQEFCNDEIVYWFENFGTGTAPVSHPDIIPGALTYQASGILTNEGTYRVVNNTQQMPEWHASADHTPNDVDGRMLVINGQSETFFRHVTTNLLGYDPGPYSASLYLMNVNTPGTCAPDPLLPNITFQVEYLNQNNTWVPLINSPVVSNFVPQSANPTWVVLGGVFTLPPTGSFIVTQMRITLSDGTTGGCGNDFAIDDIKLASCPSGGPVPVVFSGINAQVKGSGVQVNWTTSSEINNDYFEVEHSINGNSWTKIATVKGNGTTSQTSRYQTYHAKPGTGRNLYRVRQVDLDGRSKLSPTASVNISAEGTTVTILNNPVQDVLMFDLRSNKAQVMQWQLTDLSGRKVTQQTLRINNGYQRFSLPVSSSFAKGLYVWQLIDENDQVIVREKILLQ